MAKFFYAEAFINRDNRTLYYDGTRDLNGYYSFEGSTGDLYRSLRSAYGRCIGHISLDTKSRGRITCGWVFVKRVRYDDRESYGHPITKENSFVREAWISLHDGKPQTTFPKCLDIAEVT